MPQNGAAPRHLILKCVDLNVLELLQRAAAEAVDMACVLMDVSCGFLTRPMNNAAICTTAFKLNQGTRRCHRSDREGCRAALKAGKPVIYACLCGGLSECAVPILLDEEPIAVCCAGQVITDLAQKETVKAHAEALGVDMSYWSRHVEHLRYVPPEDFEAVGELLSVLFHRAVEMGRRERLVFDPKRLLGLMGIVAQEVTGADAARVLQVDRETGELRDTAPSMAAAGAACRHKAVQSAAFDSVLASCTPTYTPDVSQSAAAEPRHGGPGVGGQVALPFTDAAGQTRGLIVLDFLSARREFSDATQRRAELAARVTGCMVSRFVGMELRGTRNLQLDVLHNIDVALARHQPIGETLRQIAEHTCRIANDSFCQIWLLDDRFRVAELMATTPSFPGGPAVGSEVALDESFMVHVYNRCRPLTRSHLPEAPEVSEDDAAVAEGAQSLISVPLMTDRGVAGFINLTTRTPHFFYVDEEAFLCRAAERIMEAIRRSHHERILMVEKEMADVHSRVTSLDAFLDEMVRRVLPNVFDCKAASLFLIDHTNRRLRLAATSSGLSKAEYRDKSYERGEGLTGWVWRNNQTLRIPDDVRHNRAPLKTYEPEPIPVGVYQEPLPHGVRRQLLATPLVSRGSTLGVMRVCGRSEPWRLNRWDEEVARMVAQSMANTIANLRTIEQQHARLAVLSEIGDAIHREGNVDRVLGLALSGLTCVRARGFDRAVAWLFDVPGENLEPRAAMGGLDDDDGRFVWQQREPLTVDELMAELDRHGTRCDQSLLERAGRARLPFTKAMKPILGPLPGDGGSPASLVGDWSDAECSDELRSAFGPHAYATVALRSEDMPIGVIYVDNAFSERPLPDEDREFLESMTRQVGLAVYRLQVEERERQRKRLHAMLLDRSARPQEALDHMLEPICETFGFKRCLLFFHDRDTGLISAKGSVGFDREAVERITFAAREDAHAVTPKVIAQGECTFIERAEDSEEIDAHWQDKLGFRGPFLAMPLTVGNVVYGALVINDEKVRRDHRAPLDEMTGDLALALALTHQTERANARQRVIELMALVQSLLGRFRLSEDTLLADLVTAKPPSRVGVDEEEFLNDIAGNIASIFKAHLCAVYCPVDTSAFGTGAQPQEFRRVGAYGYPLEIRDDRRRPSNTGLTNEVLRGTVVNEPSVEGAGARWSMRHREVIDRELGLKVRAFMGVPLWDSSGNVMGAITLTRRRVSEHDGLAFSTEEVDLMAAMAMALGVVMEMTHARRQAERRQLQLESMLDAVAEEICVVDRDFNIILVNKVKRERFKHDGDLVGRKCYHVYEKSERLCPNCPTERAMQQARECGRPKPVIDDGHIGKPKDGEEYNALVVANAIVDPDTKAVLGAVEVVHDLTAREREINEPIEVAAHDVCNKLNVIRDALSNILFAVRQGYEQCDASLRALIERQYGLVANAQTFARRLFASRKTLRPERSPHDMGQLIENILREVHVPFVAPQDQRWRMCVDPILFALAIHELVNNARQAVAATGRELEFQVHMEPWSEDGEERGLQITVSDNGPGIELDDPESAFSATVTTKGNACSHGFGLFGVRRIIRAHGGSIQLRQIKGRGAVFEIRLPKGLEENDT